MRRAVLALFAFSLTTAMPALAQDPVEIDPAAAERVIGMFRSYGCSLNVEQIALFEDDLAVTPEEYTAILADAVDRGFATGDASVLGDVTLTDAFCGPQHAEPVDVLVEVMRYNNCELSGTDAPRILLPMGFMPQDMPNLIAQLRSEGRMIVEQSLLTLTPDACAR